MDIRELLKQDFVSLDGSMGAVIMAKGFQPADILKLNIERPDVIKDIHKGYFDAGSDIVFTDTFDLSVKGAERIGLNADDIITAAIRNADDARKEAGHGFIALDLSPSGMMKEEEAFEHYSYLIRSAADRTDLLVLETIAQLSDIRACIRAAKEYSSLPLFVSMSFTDKGRTWFGDRIKDYIELVNASDIACCGINCTLDPEEIYPFAVMLKENTSVPVFAKPNRGQPVKTETGTSYNMTPEDFAEKSAKLYDAGIHILGGCCGNDAECIRMLNSRLR